MPPTLARAGRLVYDQAYLLLSFTAFAWASNTILGRFVAGHVPPVQLAWLRWWIAFAIVLPFAWPHLKRDLPALRAKPGVVLALSFLGITCYNTLAYYGLQYTDAVNALLIQSTAPLLIAIWTFVLYRDRLTGPQAAGIVVSGAGVAVIVARGDWRTLAALEANPGDLLFLLALVLYAAYSAVLRLRPAVHWLTLLAATFGIGAALLTPAMLWEVSTGFVLTLDTTTLLALAYVSTVPSILAYICFNRGIELVGANRAGPFFHLIPVFGSVLAIVVLGESFRWYHGLGYALVVGGIVVAARR